MNMRSPAAAVAAILTSLALLSGCGGGDETSASSQATPRPVDLTTAKIATDLKTKPDIPAPTEAPPPTLVKRDIVPGTGRVAKTGDKVSMQYVGMSWSTGKDFDASWDRGQPFDFTLGEGGVIKGWDQGIPGMREGGRRLLIIPPDLGYGETGSGQSIVPNETLAFVVDLTKVK